MIALLFALSLQPTSTPTAPPSGWIQSGRLIDTTAIHLGIRPQVFIAPDELDLGITLQLSTTAL